MEREKEMKRRRAVKRLHKDDQPKCCFRYCENSHSTRWVYSLKYFGEDRLRVKYTRKGWERICNYHYFSDLYYFKKNLREKKTDEEQEWRL